jgi:hypothetical protein
MSNTFGNNLRSAITIGQIMKRVIGTGKVTRADEVFFRRALISHTVLTPEDLSMLESLMKRMEMGLIKVVDE